MTIYHRSGLYILARSVDDARLYDPATDTLGPSRPLANLVHPHAREWMPVVSGWLPLPDGLMRHMILPFPDHE